VVITDEEKAEILKNGWKQMRRYTIWMLAMQFILVLGVTGLQYFNHMRIYDDLDPPYDWQDHALM
jgi:hypothetical protein